MSTSESQPADESAKGAPRPGFLRRNRRSLLVVIILLAVILPVLALKFQEFLFRHSSKVELVLYNPSPRTIVLAADAPAARELCRKISLFPKGPCRCAFSENLVFHTWLGKKEVYASGHTFNFQLFGLITFESRISPGFWQAFTKTRKEAFEKAGIPFQETF